MMCASEPPGVLKAYKVAVVQMDSGSCKEENLRTASSCIDKAAASGAQLICFPEGMSQICAQYQSCDYEPVPGPTTDLLAQKACEHGVYIHGGSLQERIEGDAHAYNTSVLLSPTGELMACYRKMHMFDVSLADGTCSKESERVKPGSDVVVVQTSLGAWGCAICYDIRFPEMFRMMALLGAHVLLVPANFTYATGCDHWEILLRARAIENGCYVLAADQCGDKPEFTAYGHSMIVDPWGAVLAEASGGSPGIIYAEIDPARIDEVRAQVPVLANRRADVYGSFEAPKRR